jgi:tetratricopeptide (TPR) repeat protein
MYTAAALADLAPDDAEDILEVLLDDNILRQDTPGRYYFHDLVRECSQELRGSIEKAAQQEALVRLFDYYLSAVHLWGTSLNRDLDRPTPDTTHPPDQILTGNTDHELKAILDDEYRNIAELIRFASEHSMHRYAWQLVYAVEPYLRLRNYDGNARQLIEIGLHSARADHDLAGESACLLCMVSVCRQRGSVEDTQAYLAEAARLSERTGDARNEAIQLAELGTLQVNDDRLLDAYRTFQKAEQVVPPASNEALRASIVNNLGVVCRDLGEFDDALLHLRDALRIARAIGNKRSELRMLWNIGAVLQLQGGQQASHRVFTRVLEVSGQLDYEYGESLALLALASADRQVGDLDGALERGRRALTIARRMSLRKIECDALEVLGETFFSLRNPEDASGLFDQARELSIEYRFGRYTARALEGLAHVAWLAGDLTEAGRHWHDAVELYPDDIVDTRYAKAHLATLEDPTTTCFRCVVQPARTASPFDQLDAEILQ